MKVKKTLEWLSILIGSWIRMVCEHLERGHINLNNIIHILYYVKKFTCLKRLGVLKKKKRRGTRFKTNTSSSIIIKVYTSLFINIIVIYLCIQYLLVGCLSHCRNFPFHHSIVQFFI